MTGEAHTAYTTAAVVAAAGVAGYYRARSRPSLAAGVAIGGGLAAAAYTIDKGREYEGHVAAAGLSALLSAATVPRAIRSRKMMPAGVLGVVGLVSTAYHARKAQQWSPTPS